MPTVLLTARFVSSIKATPGKRVEYLDEDVAGLALRVTEGGVKSWTLRYRHRGRLRRLTLGSEDALTLAQARERAREELHAASKGADPATAKQAGRTAETIDDLAALYIERWAKPRKRSWKADDNLLRRRILPRWRHRAIVDITRQDVRELVEQVVDAGAPIVANRVAALLSKLFSFAVDRDLIETSPAVRIRRPVTETTRDRVLSEDELRTFWAACDGFEPAMAALYQLRLLTAQRGGEVAGMRWQDVDLESGWWTIPSAIAKNKLAHRVPLSNAVVDIIAGQLQRSHKNAALVFEARRRTAGAGARGKRQQALAAAACGIENFRGHDLRRSAASYMASGGVPRLTIKKILNHADRDITAVYDRHSYDPEKRAALDWWAVKLRAILAQTDGAKVLPFAARA